MIQSEQFTKNSILPTTNLVFVFCFFGSVVIGVAFLSDLLASSAFYSPLRKENKNKKKWRGCVGVACVYYISRCTALKPTRAQTL